jgi:hypothetical protein
MSYRYSNRAAAAPEPSLRVMMTGLLVGFVVVSLLVFLFGRVPFTPSSTPLSGTSYKEYVARDTELLTSYGRTQQGTIHIPIDRAMDLTADRGLPTRDNPSPTP